MALDPERINRLKYRMKEMGIDAFLCRLPENVTFLSGWWPLTGTSWAIFTAEGQSHLVVPACEAVEAQAGGITGMSTYEWGHLAAADPEGETIAALRSAFRLFGIEEGNIGIDEDFESIAPPLNVAEPSLPSARLTQKLMEVIPEASFFIATSEINNLRVRKTPSEVEKFRTANEIAGFGLQAFRQEVRPGITEIEIAASVNQAIAIRGSGYKGVTSARGFAQVSSGQGTEKAWRPCVVTGNRKLQKGDIVLLELGAVADGYWADNTRCMVAGGPDPGQKKIYDVVLRAQTAAREAIKPGVPMSEVDRTARDIIEKEGYGKYFIHITGHGVGWRYHEFPPLLAPGNHTLIEEGMVTSVEPGVYIPGFGGFRIEDNVAVGREGPDNLSTFSRDLE